MRPALTRAGVAYVATSVVLVAASAVLAAWPLLALCMAQVSLLFFAYAVFVPVSLAIKQRKLAFCWWIDQDVGGEGSARSGRVVTLRLQLRNETGRMLRPIEIQALASSAIELDQDGRLVAAVPPAREVCFSLKATPRAAGIWLFQGAVMRVTDPLGLFAVQVYYPQPLPLRALPRVTRRAARRIPFGPQTGSPHERSGPRLLRQRGMGTNLREIRDHVPGDPFRRIVWKATARTRRLMVRELESEILVNHWLLLDISPTMRSGTLGTTALDFGIELVSGLSRVALDSGDRVGLLTFDTRIFSEVAPADGRPQLLRIVSSLLRLHRIADEDLTDVTNDELYDLIASYVAYQRGIDLRLRRLPRRTSQLWRDLVDTGRGYAIRRDRLHELVFEQCRLPQPGRKELLPPDLPRASTLDLARLRQYCLACGIELPYRQHSMLAPKHEGMASAILRAAAARNSQFIVLISDLEDIVAPRTILESLCLALRHHHRIVVVVPYPSDPFAGRHDLHARRMRALFQLRHDRQQRQLRRDVQALGIQVIAAGPRDTPERILHRLVSLTSRGQRSRPPLGYGWAS
jgi:uncharacterized protein (DUF58 family)